MENWYKLAQESIAAESIPISMEEVRSIIDRAYNKNREFLKEDGISFKEFSSKENQDMLEQTLWSDSEFYYRSFKNIPEEITISDILDAYFNNQLTPTKQQKQLQNIPFKNVPPSKTQYPYQNKKLDPLDENSIKDAWLIAAKRIDKNNEKEVNHARYEIYLQWMTNKELSHILNMSQSEINKRIKYWTNINLQASRLHDQINKDVPDQVQWHGLLNSSFLSKREIKPEDINQFVAQVKASNKSGWDKQEGKHLRSYILRSFLALNTNIDYKNLSFQIDQALKPNGEYSPMERLITVRSSSSNTIAHEIGHYLDYKWGEEADPSSYEYGRSATLLFDSYKAEGIKNPARREWTRKLYDFVLAISERGDVHSEYSQDRKEVFARFVAKFIEWTNSQAGERWGYETTYFDKFRDTDFQQFVRLLQEKAYVDIVDPPKVPATKKGVKVFKGWEIEN